MTTKKKSPTEFAPAERAAPESIERQARLFDARKLLGLLPDAVPCVVLVVNQQRQIVFANERVTDLLPPERQVKRVLGLRPGEALGCTHAFENEGGCGTSEFCRTCGAVGAVLASQNGNANTRECRITRGKGSEALEFRVWTTPVAIDGEAFTIFAALDIAHEKRREALERTFLHDIYNVAYGLSWYGDFLKSAAPDKVGEHADTIRRLTRELIEEIDAQRVLLRAETGELVLTFESMDSRRLLQETVELYSGHPVCHNRRLRIDDRAESVPLVSDRTLLLRVLCNMVKNALEACRPGETVTVSCVTQGNEVEFRVHNAGFMPRNVQLQIFQRSFSTKGRGRGLGTYSIRLLTERYLKGSVSFTTSAEAGTTFRARYPLAPDDRKSRPGLKAGP